MVHERNLPLLTCFDKQVQNQIHLEEMMKSNSALLMQFDEIAVQSWSKALKIIGVSDFQQSHQLNS